MIESYFTDIELHITQELMCASKKICVAVAWFTNPNLLRVLTFKKKAGLQVEVIINDDDNNKKLNFDELLKIGGLVYVVSMPDAIMHNKFCIIDDNIVIHGSYNWTRRAENNKEQISICKNDSNEVEKYIEQFNNLKNAGKNESQRNNSMGEELIIPYRLSRLHGQFSLNQHKLLIAIVKLLQPQILLLNDRKQKRLHLSSLFNKYDEKTIAIDIPFNLIQEERVRHDSFKTVAKSLAFADIRYPKDEGRGITLLSESNIFPEVDYNNVKGMPTTIRVFMNAREMDNLFSLDKGYIKMPPKLPELFKKKRSLQTYMFLKRYTEEKQVIIGYNNLRRLYGNALIVPEKYSQFKRTIMEIVKEEFDEMYTAGIIDFTFEYFPVYPAHKDRGVPNDIEFKLKVKLQNNDNE